METRRDFIKTTAFGLVGAGAVAKAAKGAEPAKPTPRFIFMRKSNGTWPEFLAPKSLNGADKEKDNGKQALNLDLSKHDLPDWMAPLSAHRQHIGILQGLSAKMCQMGHSTYQSPLAVCRAAERSATIARASVDVVLGRMFSSPMEHIELTCAKNQKGIVTGMSSIGPKQPNFAYASPSAAFKSLFAAGSDDADTKTDLSMDDGLYSFLANSIKSKGENLNAIEGGQKIGHYANSVDDLVTRNKKLKAMSAQIRKYAPKLSKNVMADSYTTPEQHAAYGEILAASLCAGLSNVATLTFDDLQTVYSGLYETNVNLHELGHGKDLKGLTEQEIRGNISLNHMKVVDKIVQTLKQTPEGDGNMFDNTVIMYLPENGEKHHSVGTEVPFLILAGKNFKLNTTGRYTRLPNYNEPGHKTLGNFYTTILNAYGNPIKHYGDFDPGLKINQEGAIKELLS